MTALGEIERLAVEMAALTVGATPAVPREVVTVEEIVAAWDSIACNAPTSSLPSDAVRAAVERFVGSVIAGGG